MQSCFSCWNNQRTLYTLLFVLARWLAWNCCTLNQARSILDYCVKVSKQVFTCLIKRMQDQRLSLSWKCQYWSLFYRFCYHKVFLGSLNTWMVSVYGVVSVDRTSSKQQWTGGLLDSTTTTYYVRFTSTCFCAHVFTVTTKNVSKIDFVKL